MACNREALEILEEFNVTVVPKNIVPKAGETRSVATVQRIARRHGRDHARFVIQAIVESQNNKAGLTETVIGAVSDIVLVFKRLYPTIYEKETSRIFEFLDQTPIATLELMFIRNLEGITNRRSAFVGLLNERVVRVFGTPQLDLLDDRRMYG
ncbi:hypothetical protein [Allorhizobium ampelinum]|uniref:hypothetical protein n=1 Tax=Allorhizobium ampelinum TaxID=3025782 RepID=UPI000B40553C|nr:hypothetical protein [Allorhizobium ampelinum]NTA27419.1 hypothetical protein [Allorhizobium ampelinum]OVE94476.1 hypothetical protein B7W85_13065 [Allorhizobium ampelinum]